MKVEGGCHCGAVRFEIEVPKSVEVVDCNCSVCALAGFRHLGVPHERFRLLNGAEKLSSYRFGTGMAEHLFCSICGIKSFYQPRSHPHEWSVNWNALDSRDGLIVRYRSFDGQNWEEARPTLPG